MDEAERRLQKKHLEILVRNGGFQFTDTFFPYTSGEIGPYYVQSAVVMNNGGDYYTSCKDIENLIVGCEWEGGSFYVVSGGESRDWIFSLPIALELGKPHTMIYKDCKMIGADVKGRRVVHVADLNNEGSSPRDKWVPAIRKAGGKITDIFFYVDRMEEGVKVMQELGLRRHAVVELDYQAWDYLKTQGVVTEEVYKNLIERGTSKESRDAWAINMLQCEKGLGTLGKLFVGSKSDREKAHKIINHYNYLCIIDLVERLNKKGYRISAP